MSHFYLPQDPVIHPPDATEASESLGTRALESIDLNHSKERLAAVPERPRANSLSQLTGFPRRFHDEDLYKLIAEGGSLYAQYKISGAAGQLDKAINCWRTAASLSSNSHIERPKVLNDLGRAYLHCFERFGKLPDLEMSIEFGEEAVLMALDGSPGKPSMLNNLGNSYQTRFESLGELADLNKAIEFTARAALLTPDDHVNKPAILENLGNSYQTRFERLGGLSDIHKAIECGAQAAWLTPYGHTNKPMILDTLGISYRTRFEHLGNLVDLDKAIECGVQAADITPGGHEEKPGILNNLGNSFSSRFKRFGKLGDLEKSIHYQADAVALTSEGDPDRPGQLSNLGVLYRSRFDYLGELSDINSAIEWGTQAVSIAPDGHIDKPRALNNLGVSYLTRFKRLETLADLGRAIECGDRAALLSPADHPENPAILNTLGNSYRNRFNRLGELVDLDKAIECEDRAASLTPESHANKPMMLNNLGISYRTRFDRLGGLVDLNKAIENGGQAVILVPNDHPEMSNMLNNLGNSHLRRYERLGELTDLNRAVKHGAQAVLFTTNGHPDKPGRLNNLGVSYRARYERLGEQADLDEAIECGTQAVSLTSDGHPEKSNLLSNLGSTYQTRFDHLGDLPDLEEALKCRTQAATLTADSHASKPAKLHGLGISFLSRFERLRELLDLSNAVECGVQAVSLTPDGHADKPSRLHSLGNSYSIRYDHSHQLSDLESAIACFKNAAQSPSGPPVARFRACRSWAQLTSRHAISPPYPAYQQAMELLPQLIWVGTTLERRYGLITEVGDFTTEAASHAISILKQETALEWLEAGRSIVWGQIAQLRTPFEQLFPQSPDLANRLKEVSHELELAGSRSSLVSSLDNEHEHLGTEASRHVQLAMDWGVLLTKAQSIPGFEDFLRPLTACKLLGTAKAHPIAIINTHTSRCDALVIRPNNSAISHVPLNNFSVSSAMAARKCLVSQVRQRKIGRLKSNTSLEKPLSDLWVNVLKPILDFLGYTRKLPIEELPRITWCTTGLLSFLPLHAAGCYDGYQHNAFDLVVSSYTPTLSILLAQQSADPATHCKILAVGQENTPGLDSLPGTKEELAIITKHAHEGQYLKLEDNEATIEKVLDAMERFNWVHMACHGSQNTNDPTQSAFHLHDGNLTLATITKKIFKNKGLAFLSACQTATGDQNVPEEAVHLAAGMLMAGFPSVIGTMWSIADSDGPRIADKVYASLLKDRKTGCAEAARALHEAVAELRALVGETSFERWAPFIHIGL